MERRTSTVVALTLLAVAVSAAAGVALFVRSGVYDLSADKPHLQPIHSLLDAALRHSVRRQARSIEEPELSSPALVARGAVCFREHCVACHGAPGVAPGPAGLAMAPLPGPLVDAAHLWRARELVWITRHGIRMSGMPAWGQRLNDDDIWALAAFMLRLPKMSTADYTRMSVAQAQLECSAEPSPSDGPAAPAATSTPSVQDAPRGADDAETRRLGRIALRRHGCHGCHVIPGVVGSPRHVGPSLAGYGLRSTIKGRLPNSAEQLAAWIRAPQSLDPDSAMPTIAIGESDARAMAVYLRSLR